MAIGKGKSKYASPAMMKHHLPHCGACKFFDGRRLCGEDEVIEDAKSGILPLDKVTGKAVVEARGCCNLYTPK